MKEGPIFLHPINKNSLITLTKDQHYDQRQTWDLYDSSFTFWGIIE